MLAQNDLLHSAFHFRWVELMCWWKTRIRTMNIILTTLLTSTRKRFVWFLGDHQDLPFWLCLRLFSIALTDHRLEPNTNTIFFALPNHKLRRCLLHFRLQLVPLTRLRRLLLLPWWLRRNWGLTRCSMLVSLTSQVFIWWLLPLGYWVLDRVRLCDVLSICLHFELLSRPHLVIIKYLLELRLGQASKLFVRRLLPSWAKRLIIIGRFHRRSLLL